MVVIKRDGREEKFCKSNIFEAIIRAFAEDNGGTVTYKAKEFAKYVSERLYDRYRKRDRAMSVEEIQNDVQVEILRAGYYEVAIRYIKYRYEHELMRNNRRTDGSILALVDGVNESVIQENSNKNPTILSTQRDYMAGEVSKDISMRLLLPKDIVEAHEAGIIHFHDSDYYAQHMFNCFSSRTRFVTRDGVVSFSKCRDGQDVEVLSAGGEWKHATVRYYGKRKLYDITLKSSRSKKVVTCTKDHRWVLGDGSVTTSLSVGDQLFALVDSTEEPTPKTKRQADMFSLGFILGDGSDTSCGMTVRLCGNKVKYAEIMKMAGYNIVQYGDTEDLTARIASNRRKKLFLDSDAWEYLQPDDKKWLFYGLFAADGATNGNSISTANEHILKFILSCSAIAGYHVANVRTIEHDTNFKDGARLYKVTFRTHQNNNNRWIVESIDEHRNDTLEQDVWCVEEPDTHTFTLDGGVVTGNCNLVNLDDMLQNGTVISGTMIEKPHSFSTACNIATQIIAQVASNQYGGQSISLSHLAPFVDVSRKKIREEVTKEFVHANNVVFGGNLTELSEKSLKAIEDITEARVREEVKRGVQTIQYQVVTLMTTNGQAPFITVFMYLNEVSDPQTKADLAMIIEEVVRQRIEGVKNEKGVWITPAFPKLIYVLEEDNITAGSKYWYLTQLCAECTAKRMVPDYISEKLMLQNKIDKNGEGHCYPCMNKTCA